MGIVAKIVDISGRYKILRGMLAYSLLWPLGSLAQQTIEGRNYKNYDWRKCLRFCLYGTFILGPAIHGWLIITRHMWPRTNLRTSIAKAAAEQFSFDPIAIMVFLFVMSLAEGKSVVDAKTEVEHKFIGTFQVGVAFWPIVQTINFTYIPGRNQVVFMSFFSMLWTTFLAYRKHLEVEKIKRY